MEFYTPENLVKSTPKLQEETYLVLDVKMKYPSKNKKTRKDLDLPEELVIKVKIFKLNTEVMKKEELISIPIGKR